MLHPYTGGEFWHDTGGVLKYHREEARADHFKVLVIGGSVAASFARTLENRLPDLLRDAPALKGKRVTIQNYAHASYKQPQQVMRLVYLLSLGYRPDAVINVDGFNEVAQAFGNGRMGVHPVYPSSPVWRALAMDFGVDIGRDAELLSSMFATRVRLRATAAGAARWHLCESSILGRWTRARMSALESEFVREQTELLTRSPDQSPRMLRQLNGPDFDPADDAVMASCVSCWVEGSMCLQDLCASRAIPFVHVLQPTLHDVGAKPMHDVEKAFSVPDDWLAGVRIGYPLLRERANELRAHGVNFLDASRVFADVEEPLYLDACHHREEGERIWFDRMATELRAAIVGP